MSRAVMQQALEALEWNYNTDLGNIPACEQWAKMLNETITALRAALAEPEQEVGQALKRAIERNNELEAELHEQARVNGMGSEREARLMALNAELAKALREMLELWQDDPAYGHDAADRARAALAKVEASK